MELIVISDNKLKIMLSAPEMERYELENERMDCTDAHTREAFRHIFSDARDRIGFETEGARLFIQLYTSKEGGCEIFVTKLARSDGGFPFRADGEKRACEVETGDADVMSDGERALLRLVYGDGKTGDEGTVAREWSLREEPSARIALSPASVEDLLAICRRLSRGGYRGSSSAYIADGGSVYLFIEIPCEPGSRLPLTYSFLSEYGEVISAEGMETYLTEHGQSLRLGDAVEILGTL